MTPEPRFVYVLRSTRYPDHYYAGITSNVMQRLATHNSGGNKHTKLLRPWELVVTLQFESTKSAELFERYLKSGSGRAFAKRHFV